MIGWLRGETIETWKEGSKKGVLVDCGGVGYEVQISPRHLNKAESSTILSLWVHQVQREDETQLFGFFEKADRNLFRILIRVNGVGPKIALAILDEFQADEIIQAIIHEDINKLNQVKGVGKRIAERISAELRDKLSCSEEKHQDNYVLETQFKKFKSNNFLELQQVLQNLGYEDLEILRALKAITHKNSPNSSEKPVLQSLSPDNMDQWLRASLEWLSKEAA